jgi:hypothetical protein
LREAVARAHPEVFDTLVLLVRQAPGRPGEPAVVIVREVYKKGALRVGKAGISVPGIGRIPYEDWLASAGFADRPPRDI